MKKGFTLIELMVVVVIIGILAAVAVPKLFGMIAKSKASEVGPAAGEYVKLQNAYVAETGDQLGNWFKIGYSGPGTMSKVSAGASSSESTNFKYKESWTPSNGSVALSAGGVGWTAANKAKLNGCAGDGTNFHWVMTLGAGSAAGEVTYTPSLSGDTDGECGILTPQFTTIK